MEFKVLRQEKNEIELELDNLTVVELLRHYLTKESSVEFVAWKREHPTKNPILKLKTSGKDSKSIIESAIKSVLEDLESLSSEFKKTK